MRNQLTYRLFFIIVLSTFFVSFVVSDVSADVIIDNGMAGTSSTGSWPVSGGTGPYGADSLWARDGATYTWSYDSQPSGSYEVLLWWSGWTSRSTSVDVEINYHGAIETVQINQLENPSQWYSLGTYNFDTSGSVTIIASDGSTVSTCADAVWFRLVSENSPPIAYIDSISPNPADPNELITFIGHGEDPNDPITAHNWESSISGVLSTSASFSSVLTAGVHAIVYEVQDGQGFWSEAASEVVVVGSAPVEIIVDNLDADTDQTGTWQISGAPDPYGSDSVWSREGGTFTWYLTPPQAGGYDVSMWWTALPSRSTSAEVVIDYFGGSESVYVNQQQDGGQWIYLGTYLFDGSEDGAVTIMAEDPYPVSYCADAVKFDYNPGGINSPPTAFIDSITPNPATVGEEVSFVGHGEDADGTIASCTWSSSINGELSTEVSFTKSDLSVGEHVISMIAYDDDGAASTEVTATLTVDNIVVGETIIDNGDPETSSTGSWSPSSALDPYGVNSYWARDGATYTWTFTPAVTGTYELSMWWTEWTSRSDSVPVEIEYDGGTATVNTNQQVNGGQWNVIDIYPFVAGVNYNVTITSQPAPSSTCADAVKFSPVVPNAAPTAFIDSITPNPAAFVEEVSFTGHGEDTDGTIAGCTWSSSIDGEISAELSFTKSDLSLGEHIISMTVYDDGGAASVEVTDTLTVQEIVIGDAIIDNGDIETSSTGSWSPSSALDPYGVNSYWARDGATYTWTFTPAVTGTYELSMWWTEWTSRSTSVPVEINYNGSTTTETVDQLTNGGQWNVIGNYPFVSGVSYNITITSQPNPTSTCADAVKFVYVGPGGGNIPPTATIDSITPNPANEGELVSFVGHGDDTDGTVDGCVWSSSIDGELSTEVSFTKSDLTVGGHTISMTVFDNDGAESTPVTQDISIVPISNAIPTAFIDSITPNPANEGELVSFVGHGDDTDGTVDGCVWSSSIDGEIGTALSFTKSDLTSGDHTISMTVFDNAGAESTPVTQTLTVVQITGGTETIIDNGDSNTSSTGVWSPSSGALPYGVDSVWSRDGSTYTWTFTPDVSGAYEVSMCWTEWTSRSGSVPVEIAYDGGTAATTVNQQINGGQWNVIGSYTFIAGVSYDVTITSQPDPTSTCADALRCVYLDGGGGGVNTPPEATIDSIGPNPVLSGQTVNFTGHGSDTDGTIIGYNWRSSINGNIGISSSISTSTLSVGTHTIYFMVQDDQLDWSSEVSSSLEVTGVAGADEHIFACFGYGPEDSRYVLTNMLEAIGASQQGTTWTYTNGSGKTFVVHMVTDTQGMIDALKTPGAHVLYYGHSNYGLGPIFATSEENAMQMIQELYYIDDDRILNVSSPIAHVNIGGMRTGQAYPYWWPIYQDGTSGIAPYDFGDPRGDPPYNYYLAYQPPGYSEYFKVETVRNGAIERFSDSPNPAWFSADGSTPDSSNPDHLMYFITNPDPWSQSFEAVGNWTETVWYDGFFKESTLYCPAGTGSSQATWMFDIPIAGDYKILGWWSASLNRPSNAPYTVNHSSGNTTFLVDQRFNGGQWNEIGQVHFEIGSYSVVLTDDCDGGLVFADAIMVSHVDNPPDIMEADFYASTRSGTAPLEVNFENTSTGDYTTRHWNFGDGAENDTRDWIEHVYQTPGTYTVTLDVSGPLGSSIRTKVGYITVTASESDPPLQAEFDSWRTSGPVPLTARFYDGSSGNFEEGITYTPNPGFTGTDTFTYMMYDKEGVASNEATVEILVYSGNVAPVANDDDDNTRPDTAVDIDVLDNDMDIGGSLDATSVTISGGAGNGTTSVDVADGTVTYTPNGGFDGTDTFSYTVLDSDGAVSNVATVSVFVGNMAPVANDNYAETELNTPEDINVLYNDRDTDGSVDETTVVVTSGPSNGTVEVNPINGMVTYTPNSGYEGPDSFSYTVADDEGLVSNVAVVNINPENVAPVANDDSAYTSSPDEVNIEVLDNDDDEEGIDPATMVITSQPINGTLEIHDCWSWDFGDGTTSHERYPRHTYEDIGNYTVSLTVTDLNGSSDTEVKPNVVRAMVHEDSIDNVDYPKRHYRSKTLLMNKEMEVEKEDLRYDRMFYLSCNSGDYFIDTFNRGKMFYTLNTTGVWGGRGFATYLEAYFNGQSDQAIWSALQQMDAVFDYFDFTQPPPVSSVSLSRPKVNSASNKKSATNKKLGIGKVAQIQMLDGSVSEIFEQLKDSSYLIDENLLRTAISVSYADKITEAVDLAVYNIQDPITEIVENKLVNRNTDFYISRKILQVFGDESVDCLISLNETGDNSVRGNVIQASCDLMDDEQIRNMVVSALDDKSPYNREHLEIQGEPLRICDLAYNQLVLYYNASGLLRTIGTSHMVENRDYHIEELKKQL